MSHVRYERVKWLRHLAPISPDELRARRGHLYGLSADTATAGQERLLQRDMRAAGLVYDRDLDAFRAGHPVSRITAPSQACVTARTPE